MIETFTKFAYLVAGVLFILALKWLSAPTTARRGVLAGEIGMLLAGDHDRSHERDGRDGVGERHERRVEERAHPADDLEAHEGGQDEDEQRAFQAGPYCNTTLSLTRPYPGRRGSVGTRSIS